MVRLLTASPTAEVIERLDLGLAHEEQHQELILMDLLHLFAQSPLQPAYRAAAPPERQAAADARYLAFAGGLVEIGDDGPGVAFDNERPRHKVYLEPYRLADRLVTNAEWLTFIEDGGYRRPDLWLSDGWAVVNEQGWDAPLYWRREENGAWTVMTLSGRRPLDPHAPVGHVSYYEAAAFAAWSGRRLPTEAEWEAAAATLDPKEGNQLDSANPVRPRAARGGRGLRQMFGDVWEWTASAYLPYPGFRPAEGAVGEYNGKFMSGQFVLKGASCATPRGHSRASYRNFFYPHQRWQFTGLRLAKDL
jgi:ergothioneine biosynthesis protein EgtB